MKEASLHTQAAVTTTHGRSLDRLARRAVLGRLARLERGLLKVSDGDNTYEFGSSTDNNAPRAKIVVNDAAFYSDLAFGGAVGAAEAFMQGDWTCDDLTSLVRLLVINRSVLDDLDSGFARLAMPARKILHWLNRNTRRGSRRNILSLIHI